MADLAAMAGINLGGQNQSGDGINLMLYPDIVSSTPFIVEMSQIPVRGKRCPRRFRCTTMWTKSCRRLGGVMSSGLRCV